MLKNTRLAYPTGGYIQDVPWDWNQFYEYLSMGGLQNTTAFESVIGVINTPEELLQGIDNETPRGKNFKKYNDTGINLFKKECDD